MTREQLLALGISEEQVNQIMALHGQATQSLRATVGQHEATINTLNGQLSQFQNQQPSEPTPTENPEVVELKKQIAELRSESSRKDIAVYASSKGLTGEQAENILKALGDNVDAAKSAIDSISQIISETDKNARDAEKKALLDSTPNPTGNSGVNTSINEKPEDVKNAESIVFGADSAEQSAKDYYKI